MEKNGLEKVKIKKGEKDFEPLKYFENALTFTLLYGKILEYENIWNTPRRQL